MSERMEKKIDLILEKVHSIDLTLVKQHESLVHHIKRTNLLEETIEPIKKHVTIVQGLFAVALAAAVLSSAIVGILKAIGKL